MPAGFAIAPLAIFFAENVLGQAVQEAASICQAPVRDKKVLCEHNVEVSVPEGDAILKRNIMSIVEAKSCRAPEKTIGVRASEAEDGMAPVVVVNGCSSKGEGRLFSGREAISMYYADILAVVIDAII